VEHRRLRYGGGNVTAGPSAAGGGRGGGREGPALAHRPAARVLAS
jgi:hypothetical protein